MAKRKSHKRRSHGKRARVRHVVYMGGGSVTDRAVHFGSNLLVAVGAAVLGSFVAAKLPIKSSKAKALIPLALGGGVALAMARKHELAAVGGLGMAVGGGLSLFKQLVPDMPALAGMESVPDEYLPQLGAPVGPRGFLGAPVDAEAMGSESNLTP